MKTKKHRWIGTILVVGILLAAVGAAVGVGAAQVTRSVSSSLDLTSSVVVLSSGDLELWQDVERTKKVTSLEFQGLQLQAPLRSLVLTEVVFIENRSTGDLEIIEPCRDVDSDDSPPVLIGSMEAALHDLRGRRLG